MNQELIYSKINVFDYKLTRTHLGIEEFPLDNLIHLFKDIIQIISESHEKYWTNIPSILHILDKNQSSSLVVVAELYFNLFEQLININDFIKYDGSLANEEFDHTTYTQLKTFITQNISFNQKIQLSKFTIDTSSLSHKRKQKFISLIIDYLETEAEKATWNTEIINSVHLYIAVLRNLVKDYNNYTLFYKMTGLVIDKMSFSELFQLSRDYAEELILCSYSDNYQEWGFFNFHRCFSNTSSIVRSLLYANLSLTSALRDKKKINDEYMKGIIWQGIKCFRNASLHPHVKRIYDSIPITIEFSSYYKRSIVHSYFLSLLKMNSAELPALVLDHLNEYREDMFKMGVHDAFPWLITLYNIREIYPNANFSATGLGFYITVFEMIVPNDEVKKYNGIISGDLQILKTELKNSIIKISQTRYFSDIVQDNERAISYATKLLESAVYKMDFEALILAMKIKADFSFIFKEKVRAEFSILNSETHKLDKVYKLESDIISTLKEIKGISFAWLMVSTTKYYEMIMDNSVLSAHSLDAWNHKAFRKLIDEHFFSKLNFDDTKKDKGGGIMTIFPEEHETESSAIQKQFSFAKIESSNTTLPLLLVMGLSGFPHNLLMNSENQFLHLKRPIGNILSTEWYLKYANQTKLTKVPTKTIWIPTESNDFTFSKLFAKLEPILSEFEVIHSENLNQKLYSEIVILTAHGDQNIALTNLLYTDDDIPAKSPMDLFENGKLLILFICHSGSVQSTPFKNSISTLIKEYITMGFSAVIAPFWALNILIPPIWLPIFITAIKNGDSVVKAVHQANMEIYNHYPTLSAWSCLHLYGDPHLSIEK